MKKVVTINLIIFVLSLFFASCLMMGSEEEPVVEKETDGSFDTDGDGFADKDDNCPGAQNAAQTDTDADGIGDACEQFDSDKDGINDDVDNCPDKKNTSQLDSDQDGTGDVCEDDTDNDGLPDPMDNCPVAINPMQHDKDNDGKGDICDDFDDTSDIPVPENFRIEENFPTFIWDAVEEVEFYSVEVICTEGCDVYSRLQNSGLFKSRCYDETDNKIIEASIYETEYQAGTDPKCSKREIFFPGITYKARVGAVKDGTRISFTKYTTVTIAEPLTYDVSFSVDKEAGKISWPGLSGYDDKYTIAVQCITGCAYYNDYEEAGCYNKEKRIIFEQDIEEITNYTLGTKATEECVESEQFFEDEFYYIAITYLTAHKESGGKTETVSVYYWNK